MAAQFTSIKGPLFLKLFSCNQCATSSLPDPLAPVIKTLASLGATFSIISLIRLIEGDFPIISYFF